MKLLKSFAIVAALTLLSNFLGYFRELAFASQYGATAITDAYYAAFFVPNTLYLILMAGSISTIFVPVFIEALHRNKEEAWLTASALFNISALFLTGIVVVFMATTSLWIPLLFPGFDEQGNQLVARLSQFLLPMLLFIGLSTLVSSVLNALYNFTTPALAPIVSNLFTIAIILLSFRLGGIYSVAAGVTGGMLLQLLLQLPALFKMGARYRLILNPGLPVLKKIGKLSLPLVLYLFVSYASLIVERNIASTLVEGTLSSVNYALRIFSIPLALTAGAISTIIYPRISLDITTGNNAAFSENVFRALSGVLFLLMPVSLGIMANSTLVVELLFDYGRFTANDVRLTSLILLGYTAGMVFNGMSRILQRASYVLHDTTRPLVAELLPLIVYALLAPLLAQSWGAFGLGLSRGLSFVLVFVMLLWLILHHRELLFSGKEMVVLMAKYFMASILSIAVFRLAWLTCLTTFDGRAENFVKVILFSVVAGIVYLLAGEAMHFEETAFLRRRLGSLTRTIEGRKGE